MPGNLLAKYLPTKRQQDTFIMNGGLHHAPGSKNNPPSHKSSNATNITSGSSMDDPETPSDPAQIKFLPKSDSQRSFRGAFRRWTKKEKYLMFLCTFLFLLCVVFVIVAFTRDMQLRKQLQRNSTSKMCMSKACVNTAAQLMAGMDFTADPCDDFFQFACGQWNKKHVIPEDKSTYNTFDKLHDELQIIMRELLEEPKTKNDSEATLKAKVLYKSCVNTTQIELMSDTPLRHVINDLGGWPVLDDQWSGKYFVLEDVLGKMRGQYDAPFLLGTRVAVDDKNSSNNIIQIDQGQLGMPSKEYYLYNEHNLHVQAYKRFMQDVVKLLGATGPSVQAQIDEMLNFEVKLANITRPQEERHDTGALYRKMTIRELQALIPSFDVHRFFEGFLLDSVTDDEPVVVFATTEYMQDLVQLIRKTDTRTVANYIMWRFVMEMVPELSEPYQEAFSMYQQVMSGVKKDTVRWKKCVEFVNLRMGMAVGAMFLKDNFKKESKETALEMIHDIRSAFNELLQENDWMDHQTKEFAKEKANAIVERIGYPEFITDPAELDSKYEELTLTQNFYFDNILKLQEFASRQAFGKLREPVQSDVWDQAPVVVNAFYNPNNNNILFPAGILQPLFYSSSFPKSLNYGGIGVVIGHEITHGFDDKGRQYDKDGNIKQWWDEQTTQAFRDRAQCFIDQYSQYKLEQINQYMNGKITQGENIADNGGLKQAYRAYRTWVEKNGEEPSLPGIGLDHNQLFFLNYAQIWCGKMRDEEALKKIRTSVHSLGPIRVFGPLSNSLEFSKAYSCPLGSRMNPRHKCSVW